MKYKRLRAVARRVIKGAKRECWRKYCGKLVAEKSVGEVWSAVCRMSGMVGGRGMPVIEEYCGYMR